MVAAGLLDRPFLAAASRRAVRWYVPQWLVCLLLPPVSWCTSS